LSAVASSPTTVDELATALRTEAVKRGREACQLQPQVRRVVRRLVFGPALEPLRHRLHLSREAEENSSPAPFRNRPPGGGRLLPCLEALHHDAPAKRGGLAVQEGVRALQIPHHGNAAVAARVKEAAGVQD